MTTHRRDAIADTHPDRRCEGLYVSRIDLDTSTTKRKHWCAVKDRRWIVAIQRELGLTKSPYPVEEKYPEHRSPVYRNLPRSRSPLDRMTPTVDHERWPNAGVQSEPWFVQRQFDASRHRLIRAHASSPQAPLASPRFLRAFTVRSLS